MKAKLCVAVLAVLGVFAMVNGYADDYYAQQEKLKALDKRCEDARAAKLAPVRKRLAEKCAKNPERELNAEECKTETSTYGDTSTGAQGAAMTGKDYNLPECRAAAAAWKEWEKSQGK